MKKYSVSMKHRIISMVMSLVMVITLLPATAFATEADTVNEPPVSEENPSEEPSLEEALLLEEELCEENAVPEESTENSTVFDLGDGKKAIVYHGQDVRFEEDGELVDYDSSLVTVEEKESENGESLDAYAFENHVGDSSHYIPEKLDEESQILMEKDDYSIKMMPLDSEIKNAEVVLDEEETLTPYESVEEKTTVAVYETEDEKYSYEYTSLNQGIKESIILNEKPDSNVFKFSLELTGMYAELNEEENTILLKKEVQKESEEENEAEVLAVIDRPFMNDATGEAYSEDLVYSIENQENGKYIITLTVSEDYLNSKERVYPVTIDPTATWKGTEDFLDAYVRNGESANINFYDPDTRVMPSGITNKGTYRTYFKLPGVKNDLAGKYVDSAYLTVYETGNSDAGQLVRLNRVTENWTPGTITWNNKPAYNTAAYSNQFTTTGTQYKAHKVAITATIRNFLNSNNYANYGLVMRNVTTDPEYAEFYGSRCAVASYRPKVVITYYDKPTIPSTMSVSRLTDGNYVKSNYIKQGNKIYANWTGIASHNLSAVQYKFVGINGTAQPTSVSTDAVDLTSYRSTGTATASGTNVGLSYSPSLPTGVYSLYIRGKDAAGMFGAARYKTVYVDGAAPSLTNVAITPVTTETSVTSNCTPKVSWTASDKYFSKITISVDGKTAKTVSTTAGSGSYTIPAGTISTSGVHTIRVRAYDKAGRYTGKTMNYYVDVDAPKITSLSVTPKTSDSQASADLRPQVSWTINDSSLKKVELLLNGKSKYTTTDSSVTSYKFAQGALSESGKYTITLKATDSSGNVAEKEEYYYLDIDDPVFETLQITPVTSTLTPSGNKSPTITWKIADKALKSVSYSLNGTNYINMGNSKTGSFTLPSSVWNAESGEFTIYIKAKDIAGNESAVSELTYYLGTSSDYIPKELGVTEYYGKHILSWQLDAYDAEKVVYDLHRGEEAAFTPSEATLVEAEIDAAKCLYIDKEILENDTYYYKIIVRDITGSENAQDGCSEELTVENTVTKAQFANTLGQKSYLSYLDMGLPMGNLSVEESSGNVVYNQSEFSISNAQLSYGFDRTYNSLNGRTSMLGRGWTDSWHRELYTDGPDIYYVDIDGSSYRFVLNDGIYTCEETKEYELTVTEAGYEILTKDDQLFTFNTDGQLLHISEPNGCEISYSYDGMGRLSYVISKEDKDGERKLALVYNEDSYLLYSVEDFAGTVYQYDYAGTALTKVSIGLKTNMASGVSYDYSYGENGLLVGIRDGMDNLYSVTYSSKKAASLSYPDGEKFTFTYNEGTTKVEKYTPDQTKIHEEVITFDTATGKLLSYQDAKENVTSYEYVEESPYLVAKIKNVKAYQTIDENNKVVFNKTENVVETEYVYDDNENIIEETSSDGSVSTYTYNDRDDVIAEETVKSGETIKDIIYEYDEDGLGNLEKTEDLIADTVEISEYGEDGNVTSTIVTDEGSLVSFSEIGYDDQGNVIKEFTESGNVKKQAVVDYDAMGRTVLTVENGVITQNEYDFLGRDVKRTVSEAGKEDVVEIKAYNGNGTLISESSSQGVTKQYTYDNRNRLLKTTTTGEDIATNVVENVYGYEANLMIHSGTGTVTEAIVYKESVKDTSGTVISVVYTDALGRTVKGVSGTVYTDYTYDANGNSVICYEGNTENEEFLLSMTLYDEEGKSFAEISDPQVDGNEYTISDETVVTYTEYDVKGNTSKETDALGTATSYTYNEEGKLTSTDIAEDGTDITVTYNVQEDGGEQIRVTDANGNVKEEILNAAGLTIQTGDFEGDSEENSGIITRYEYDDLGRKTVEKYSDDTSVVYSYDGDSERILTKTEYLADGITVEGTTAYTYDMKNQLTGIIHKDGGVTVAEYSYTYDVNGRVLTESVSYDSETSKVTSYEYDAEGRLIKTIYPLDSGIGTIEYVYDVLGKIESIKKDSSDIREYVYDGFNRVITIKDYDKPGSNSFTLKSYTYDGFGRTISAVYTEDGDAEKILESYTYSYDKNDNIISETRISNLPADGDVIHETRGYIYDSYGRLIESTIIDHTAEDAESITTYEYDAVGNRIKQTKDGVETTYDYNGLNQLEKVETETEGINYTYDARGNQTMESNSTTGETIETAYNVAGEMVQLVKKNNGTTVLTQTNVYNQDGSRISRTQGETEREYYYNKGVVAYTEDNNILSASNIQKDDGSVIGTYRDETYYNYLKNMQGSTESIISENGEVVAVYTYSDFGETEEVVTDSIDNEICYTGAIYDKNTGLYYMNARYYDAITGRFISQDNYRGEIEDAETWHLYAYCANNPINYVDPTGHVIFSVGVDVSYSFWLGYYKTFAVAIDSNKNLKFMITAGALVNNAGANASIAFIACAYLNYNSVDKLSNGFGASVSGVVKLGKKLSGSVGVEFSGKNKSFIVSGSYGPSVSIKKVYIEARAGVTAVSKTYSLTKIMKNYKIGKGFTTKVDGKTIKITRRDKFLEISTTNFPKKIKVFSSSKMKVV